MSIPKLDHALCAYDLFKFFDTTKTSITFTLSRKYKAEHQRKLCSEIFSYTMYLIILDIIDNNCTFVLPLYNNRSASIYAKPIKGEAFKQARQRGAFSGIDMLATNFTGYQLTYAWESKMGDCSKPIYINKRYKDIFYKNINEGKQYF